MKKILVLVVVCVLATLCLCACNPTKEPTVEDLNGMLAQDYSKTQLSIKTISNGDQLASSFEITKKDGKINIAYSIEQLAQISLENVPENYKKVATGSVVVENGAVVSQTGDQVELALEKLATIAIKFDSAFFTDATLTANKFAAKVSNPAAFLGTQSFSGSDMAVTVNFDTMLKDITITYTSANQAQVEMVYTFTK